MLELATSMISAELDRMPGPSRSGAFLREGADGARTVELAGSRVATTENARLRFIVCDRPRPANAPKYSKQNEGHRCFRSHPARARERSPRRSRKFRNAPGIPAGHAATSQMQGETACPSRFQD